MTISDPTSVKFSNQQARVAADLLARAYYLSDACSDRWNSLGGGQPAIDVMSGDIRATAKAIIDAYMHSFKAEKIWFLGTNLVIPNTSEGIADDSPADGRPAATGAKVHAVMARAIEFQNWLFSATQSFSDSARNNAAAFNTVLNTSPDGPPTLTIPNAGNLINRCNELVTNYQASGGANLNGVLAFAVHPNP